MSMRGRKIMIILTLGFLLGISLLLYPTVSDYWNSKTQSRVIENYESVLEKIEPEDYSHIFEAAYDYNAALLEVDFPLQNYEEVPGYFDALKVEGSGIIGQRRLLFNKYTINHLFYLPCCQCAFAYIISIVSIVKLDFLHHIISAVNSVLQSICNTGSA